MVELESSSDMKLPTVLTIKVIFVISYTVHIFDMIISTIHRHFELAISLDLLTKERSNLGSKKKSVSLYYSVTI